MSRARPRRSAAVPLALLLLAALVLGGCGLPRWPVEGSMTSPYGLRFRGIIPRTHHGVDIAAPEGTPVRAMAGGRVIRAGWMSGYGLTVMIDHGGRTVSVYAHLSEIEVQRGAQVSGRQVIGRVGQTGNATGPHLHFEVRRWGRSEDPVPLLGGFPPARGR